MIIHHIILQHDTIISDHIAILESSVDLLYYHSKAYAMPFLMFYHMPERQLCKFKGLSLQKIIFWADQMLEKTGYCKQSEPKSVRK